MPAIIRKSPNGWNKWMWARNVIEGVVLSDGVIPSNYTPANGFWIRSLISNCAISWIVVDPQKSFFQTTANASFSLGMVLTGMGVAQTMFSLPSQAIFGLGGQNRGPEFGYCIGNKFHQYIWMGFVVYNVAGEVFVESLRPELTQNSRFTRIYLIQGIVGGYSIVNGEHVLRLDISSHTPPPNETILSGVKINIRSQNKNTSVSIKKVNPNWDLIIDAPDETSVPKGGDYYYFDTPVCIEDPYLITGYFNGTESLASTGGSQQSASGYDLYCTSKNSPYEKGQVTGVYIWSKLDSGPTDQSSSAAVPEARSVQPVFGASMDDDASSTWAFLGNGNGAKSPGFPYPNDTRYKAVAEASDTNTTTTLSGSQSVNLPQPAVKYVKRQVASQNNYSKIQDDKNIEYIRTEISCGGSSTRNNWFAPCLKGQFIKSGGQIYKIIGHVEANVIDVAKQSVSGSGSFDPLGNAEIAIVNQYAWMINEHYDEGVSTNSTGIFAGSDVNSSTGAIKYDTSDFPWNLVKKGLAELSFAERYKTVINNASTKLKSAYKKFQNWRLIDGSGSAHIIDNVIFSSPSGGDPSEAYTISVTLKNAKETISGGNVYIVFNEPLDKPIKPVSTIEYSEIKQEETTPAYVTGDTLCLDGDVQIGPYRITLDKDDRVGYCGNYLFGISNQRAMNPYGAVIMITTPGTSTGIASVYHKLKEEDWVAYNDPVTGKVNIRKGQLDFRAAPSKSLVAVGQSDLAQVSGNPLKLDTGKDWLGRLQLKISSASESSPATDFGVGTLDNIYGFYVSGAGGVSLPPLDTPSKKSTSLPIDTWKGDGYLVSPVFAYKEGGVQAFKDIIVDMSIPTKSGPVFIRQGSSSKSYAQYFANKQVLGDLGGYDLLRISDGEMMFIYTAELVGFNVAGGGLVNATSNQSNWTNSNALMMVGSPDDGLTWTTPWTKKVELSSGNSENSTNIYNKPYPIMLLSGVEYLCSVYNRISDKITVYVRCSQNNKGFVGCFTFLVATLLNKLSLCTTMTGFETAQMDFWYRNPLIPASIAGNASKNWTDIRNIPNTGQEYNPKTDNGIDSFVRIMGESGSNAQIEYTENSGILTASLLPNRQQVLLFDSDDGVRVCTSIDEGTTWYKSGVIVARSAKSGIVIGERLLYITSSGIVVKSTNYMDFYKLAIAASKNKGKPDKNLEENIQTEFDKMASTPIGSGIIESQKLTGYVDPRGVIKVFFYDSDGLVKCMQSSDTTKWRVTNNF